MPSEGQARSQHDVIVVVWAVRSWLNPGVRGRSPWPGTAAQDLHSRGGAPSGPTVTCWTGVRGQGGRSEVSSRP